MSDTLDTATLSVDEEHARHREPAPPPPPGDPRAIDWLWGFLRIGGALVSLYVILWTLQATSLVAPLPSPVHLRHSTETSGAVRVTGTAPPGSVLEARADARVIHIDTVRSRGNVDAYLEPPEGTTGIVLRVQTPSDSFFGAQTIYQDKVPGGGVRPTRLSFAYYIPELGVLWLAGEAPLDSAVVVRLPGAGDRHVPAGPLGAFDVLVPLQGRKPDSVAVVPGRLTVHAPPGQTDGPDPVASTRPPAGRPPLITRVATVPLASLPLARSLRVVLGDTAILIRVEVALPAAHPAFRHVVRGIIPPGVFVEHVFGISRGFGELNVASVQMRDGGAAVALEGRYHARNNAFEFRPGWTGLSTAPLLGPRDRVVVVHGSAPPAWVDEPLPALVNPDSTVWHGPQELAEGRRAGIRVGLRPFARAATPSDEGREAPAAAPTVRDFMHGFENRTPPWIATLLRSLSLLIPFAGLLWIARRHSAAFGPVWNPLVAAAVIMGIWRCWFVLHNVLAATVASQLNRAFVFFRVFEPHSQAYSRVTPSTSVFVLLFVAAAGLVPLYQHRAATAGLGWSPRPRRERTGIGKLAHALGRTLVACYAATVLSLLLVLSGAGGEWLGSTVAPLRTAIAAAARPLPEQLAMVLASLACLALLLLAFGARAALLGLAVFVLGVFALAESWTGGRPDFYKGPAALDLVARIPAYLVIFVALLLAWPLAARVTRVFAPVTPGGRRLHWPLSLALMVFAVLLPRVAPRAALVVAAALAGIGVGWMVLATIGSSERFAAVGEALRRYPLRTVLLLAVGGVALAWPAETPRRPLDFSDAFVPLVRPAELFVYVVAAGLVLLIGSRGEEDVPGRPGAVRDVAVYLFAAILVNSSATWLFVPVNFLAGLLVARVWLLRPAAEVDALHAPELRSLDRRVLIQDVLDRAETGPTFAAVKKELDSQLAKAALTPQDYDDKVAAYRSYFGARLSLEDAAPGVSSQAATFAMSGLSPAAGAWEAVRFGGLLAIVPILVAFYQFVPATSVEDPYPLLRLIVFLTVSVGTWLLYAFFLGYYFDHLRGQSGLGKGVNLFAAILVPFLLHRLLQAQSMEDMRPFLFWAAQLFMYCSTLGLIIDCRTLQRHGYTVRDVRAVHNIPSLSAYASSVIAAGGATAAALLTNRVNEVVTFFVNTVLPSAAIKPPGS